MSKTSKNTYFTMNCQNISQSLCYKLVINYHLLFGITQYTPRQKKVLKHYAILVATIMLS